MSDRDLELVKSLGVPVKQIAEMLAKSRQTVNRGIHAHSEDDYFKPADLIRLLETWRSSDNGLYVFAKAKIAEIYHEIADSVLDAAGRGGSAAFSTEIPGEYWLVSGDFVGFRNGLPECARQLEALCSLDECQIKLFVNEMDFSKAKRFAEKFSENSERKVEPFICAVDLRLFPTTLLRMDLNDNMDLFGVSDAGFTVLSRQEAARMRVALNAIIAPTN